MLCRHILRAVKNDNCTEKVQARAMRGGNALISLF